ncbi:MAG: hypothetical protein IAI50_06390 [Candidatus Eremiobacteraeota bacterium]|nr:hypothetical protein [Candidatus Eremiobacteraeota bacterium]
MPYWTIPDLLKTSLAAIFAATLLGFAVPAPAAIETDPTALYATMKQAYDQGTTKRWRFANELYYQSTVFDAGRAYSLFRPTDPNYAEVAALAVDIATRLHYNPLVNNDAALWYVLEASTFVAKNGDTEHVGEANALLSRLQNIQDDPKQLARQAEADALQDAQDFHHDGDALVELLIADVRAYNLTHDPAYRSALLQHAADPATPLVRVPDPEYGQMFALAASALTDAGFTDADRAAARAIKYRRDHTPELKVIARVSAIPHGLRLTRTAPADEYFGNLKFSPIGVRNEVVRINKYLDRGWGVRMEGDALHVDDAVEDWQKQYPHDLTLPATLLDAFQLLQRVETEKTKDAAARVKTLLLVQYPGSRQAQELTAS